jgi:hypothetical protein
LLTNRWSALTTGAKLDCYVHEHVQSESSTSQCIQYGCPPSVPQCTEDEPENELGELTKSIFGESTQGLIRFAVQGMLYERNILVNPKYRGLSVESQ